VERILISGVAKNCQLGESGGGSHRRQGGLGSKPPALGDFCKFSI